MFEDSDFQDTIPDYNEEQEIYIDDTESEIDIPDNDTLEDENIKQDIEEESNSELDNDGESEAFISVQYNHKKQDFSKDEAIKLIQKGMHTEALRNKLDYIATLQGIDVNTLVDRITSAPENAYRENLEKMYGKDSQEVEIGMEIYRQKQSEEYKKILRERENSIENEKIKIEKQSVNSRLADEYIMLKNQIPDAPQYSALPDSVIIEAAEGKKDLYSAYLCYLHKEKQKIDAAKKTQISAASASSGAMKSDSGDNITMAEKNFLSGLWTK